MRPLVLAVLSASLLLSACGGGTTSDHGLPGTAGEGSATTTITTVAASPPTSTPTATASLITRFEMPPSVNCDAGTTAVTATYETSADAVAFLVDQRSVAEPPAPTSGTYELGLPCDGVTHTVVLVAVGSGGQQLATRAVQMRRPG
jgi:hypothetical protein